MAGMTDNDMIPRRYIVDDELIDDGDVQGVINPLWWEVNLYDGETEMLDALEKFTEAQRHIWAIQWYFAEVEAGGHDRFFCNQAGIVWRLALEGLNEIGCDFVGDILESAAQRIGGEPSPDRETRWLQIDRHNASFDDLDEEFYQNDSLLKKCMEEYIDENREKFYFDDTVYLPQTIAEEYGTSVEEREGSTEE